jgi:hypothetical protein
MKQWILIQFLAGEISKNVCEARYTPRDYGLGNPLVLDLVKIRGNEVKIRQQLSTLTYVNQIRYQPELGLW